MHIDIVHAIMRPMTKEQQPVKQNLKDFCLRNSISWPVVAAKELQRVAPDYDSMLRSQTEIIKIEK